MARTRPDVVKLNQTRSTRSRFLVRSSVPDEDGRHVSTRASTRHERLLGRAPKDAAGTASDVLRSNVRQPSAVRFRLSCLDGNRGNLASYFEVHKKARMNNKPMIQLRLAEKRKGLKMDVGGYPSAWPTINLKILKMVNPAAHRCPRLMKLRKRLGSQLQRCA